MKTLAKRLGDLQEEKYRKAMEEAVKAHEIAMQDEIKDACAKIGLPFSPSNVKAVAAEMQKNLALTGYPHAEVAAEEVARSQQQLSQQSLQARLTQAANNASLFGIGAGRYGVWSSSGYIHADEAYIIGAEEKPSTCKCGAETLGVSEHSAWCLKGRGVV